MTLCSAINKVAKETIYKYILYSHDDMYFCPWDRILKDEINSINSENFYLSGNDSEKNGHNNFDCGEDYNSFDEKKLLNNYKNLNCFDQQGSHFAHVINKELWNKVNGFSESLIRVSLLIQT